MVMLFFLTWSEAMKAKMILQELHPYTTTHFVIQVFQYKIFK